MGGGTYLEDFTEHELVVMGEMIDKARRDRYFGYKRKGMPKHKFIEFLQVGLGGGVTGGLLLRLVLLSVVGHPGGGADY